MLNVGVVGLGLGMIHVEAYTTAAGVGRVVICDTDESRLAEARGAVPAIAAGYTDLQAMLEAEELDAVSVVTPDRLHRPHAIACLEAGCHVLLTKPLATTLSDGKAIVDAAEGSDRLLMVAHERRFRRFTNGLKDLLDRGVLGDVIEISIDQVQDKRSFIAGRPWLFSGKDSRTALIGSGIHEVDRVRYLIGRPAESVYARGNRLGSIDIPGNSTTVALFHFEGGAIGQVTVTYDARWPAEGGPHDENFRLIGSRGIVLGNRYAHDGSDVWHELPADPDPVAAGSRGCVSAFLQALQDGRPAPVTARDAYRSLALCVAAEESARSGRPVVPER